MPLLRRPPILCVIAGALAACSSASYSPVLCELVYSLSIGASDDLALRLVRNVTSGGRLTTREQIIAGRDRCGSCGGCWLRRDVGAATRPSCEFRWPTPRRLLGGQPGDSAGVRFAVAQQGQAVAAARQGQAVAVA